MVDKKLIDGVLFYYCYGCRKWVEATKMAHFPDKNHECVECFDKVDYTIKFRDDKKLNKYGL